jgi:hypothetical protein
MSRDRIAMGTRARLRLTRVLMERVAEHLLWYALVPIRLRRMPWPEAA